MPQLSYFQGRTPAPIEKETRWTPALVWMLWKREKSLAPTGI